MSVLGLKDQPGQANHHLQQGGAEATPSSCPCSHEEAGSRSVRPMGSHFGERVPASGLLSAGLKALKEAASLCPRCSMEAAHRCTGVEGRRAPIWAAEAAGLVHPAQRAAGQTAPSYGDKWVRSSGEITKASFPSKCV